MEAFLVSTGIVALGEIGDKTTEYVICDDATGCDCAGIGTWDVGSRT